MKKCEECGYDISIDGAHACTKQYGQRTRTHLIEGLGRVTNEDDGYLTLQFKDEDAAQRFMESYTPTVDVRDMPAMREAIPAGSGIDTPVFNKVLQDYCVSRGMLDREYAAKSRLTNHIHLWGATQYIRGYDKRKAEEKEAIPAQTGIGASIDTAELIRLMSDWAGALHSSDRYHRINRTPGLLNAVLVYVNTYGHQQRNDGAIDGRIHQRGVDDARIQKAEADKIVYGQQQRDSAWKDAEIEFERIIAEREKLREHANNLDALIANRQYKDPCGVTWPSEMAHDNAVLVEKLEKTEAKLSEQAEIERLHMELEKHLAARRKKEKFNFAYLPYA